MNEIYKEVFFKKVYEYFIGDKDIEKVKLYRI